MNECGIITIGQPDGVVTIGEPICGAVPRSPLDNLRDILMGIIARESGLPQEIDNIMCLQMQSQYALAAWCGDNYYVFCCPRVGTWFGYISLDGSANDNHWELDGGVTIYPDFITADELLLGNDYTYVYATEEEVEEIRTEAGDIVGETIQFRELHGDTSGYTLYDYIRSEGNSKLQLEQVYTLGQGFEVDLEPDGYEYSRAFGDMASDACCYINEFSDVTFWLECPTQPNKIQMQMWTGRSVVRVEGHYDKFLTFLDGEQKAQRNPLDINWRFCLFGNNKGYYKGRIYAVRIFSLWESGNYFDEWLPCTNANGVAGLICMQQGGNFLTTGGLSCGNL